MFRKLDKLKQEKTKYINDIKENEDKLYAGVYRLVFNEGRSFWEKEDSFFKWLKKLSDENVSSKKKIRYFMLGKKYRIKDNLNNIAKGSSKDNSKTKSSASGDKLYVTRKGNVKVFDSNKERVTYYCEHSDLVNKAIDFNENYAKFFGKNVIIECNSDKKFIVERLITEAGLWRNNKSDLAEMSEWLGKSLCNYERSLTENDKNYVNYDKYLKEVYRNAKSEQEKSLLDRIAKALKKDDNYNMIFINQHNDLVLSNILKEKTGYTVFDYEFYGKNLFYYDFLLWFVWKAIYYREREYFDGYMHGKMDKMIQKLFEEIGTQFDDKRRKEYVYLFVLANVNMHLVYKEGIDFRKYNEFLDYLDNYVI